MNSFFIRRSAACLAALLAGTVLLTGCNRNPSEQGSDFANSIASTQTTDSIPDAPQNEPIEPPASFASKLNLQRTVFTDSDSDTGFDDSAVKITLSGGTIVANPPEAVEINGTEIIITKPDTYVFSGTLSDGRILVDLPEESQEKVHLVLNNANITSKNCAPLSILNAEKTILTVAEETVNTLSDTTDYLYFYSADGSEPNACLFAKDDLTINGSGTLTVNGNYNNGIYCKNDLKLLAYTINVKSANNAVRGNDSVTLSKCALNIEAKGDGIRTETIDTDGKGNIRIEDGLLYIDAQQDCIDAAVSFELLDTDMILKSGGGTENAAPHPEKKEPKQRKQKNDTFEEENTSVSTRGIKANERITIQNGSMLIQSADDAIHSNGSVDIGGIAYLELYAGDDGIHADDTIHIIEECQLKIESYEGIEASTIEIAGGTIHIQSDDDGLNATADAQQETQSGALTVSDGYIYIDAEGDGIDSNGDIIMTGGTVIICGPTANGDAPLDCGENQNTIQVTGGILMAVGSADMMELPAANYISTKVLNASAGTLIVVTNDDGKVLGVLQTPKDAAGLIFSANGMKDGYHIYTGGTFGTKLNEDAWATEGSYSKGTEIASE